jgi:hypothetical protein
VAELLEVGGERAAESPYRTVLQQARISRRFNGEDLLALRTGYLAKCGEVMARDRAKAIVRTSEVAIWNGSTDHVAWWWDGDSVETYRRVLAMRGAK